MYLYKVLFYMPNCTDELMGSYLDIFLTETRLVLMVIKRLQFTLFLC